MLEQPEPTLRRVVLASFAARLVTVVLGAVIGVVISRALAPEGRGAYAVVVTVASTAIALGHLSIERAQISLWKRAQLRPSFAPNAVLLGVLLGAVVAAVTWSVVKALGRNSVPVYSDLGLGIALVAVPLGLLALWTNNLLALSSRVDRLNFGLVLSAVLQTSTLLVLAALGELDVTAVVLVWVVTTAVPVVVGLSTLRPHPRSASLAVLRLEVSRGLRYHAGVALLFLLLKIDLLVVNALRPTREVGLYALAVTLAELVYLLGDAISQAIVARQAGGDEIAGAEITIRAIRLNAIGGATIGLALAATAPVLVPLIYGREFAGSVPALLVLLPGVIALAIGRPVAVLLSARDRPGILAALCGGAFLVHIAFVVILVPRLGIVGAATASSIGYGVLAGGYLVVARRITGSGWRQFRPTMGDVRAVLRH